MDNKKLTIIFCVSNILSGVNTWVFNIREISKIAEDYDVKILSYKKTKCSKADFHAKNYEQAKRYILSFENVILVPNYHWELSMLGLIRRVKVVGFCHSDSEEEYYMPISWYEPLFHRIVAVSDKCYDNLFSRAYLRRGDIQKIPYGVKKISNLEFKKIDSGLPIKILYSGRIRQHQKRIFDAVALIKELNDLGLNYEFTFAGDGVDRKQLEEKLQEVESQQNSISLLGNLSHKKALEKMAESDILVLFSDFEGNSLSLLEAMSMGVVPVVTRTNSGALELVRDSENGYLVEIGDMHLMAERIAYLAQNREQLRKMSKASISLSEDRTIEKNWIKLRNLFDGVSQEIDLPFAKYGTMSWRHPIFLMQSDLEKLKRSKSKNFIEKIKQSFRQRKDKIQLNLFYKLKYLLGCLAYLKGKKILVIVEDEDMFPYFKYSFDFFIGMELQAFSDLDLSGEELCLKSRKGLINKLKNSFKKGFAVYVDSKTFQMLLENESKLPADIQLIYFESKDKIRQIIRQLLEVGKDYNSDLDFNRDVDTLVTRKAVEEKVFQDFLIKQSTKVVSVFYEDIYKREEVSFREISEQLAVRFCVPLWAQDTNFKRRHINKNITRSAWPGYTYESKVSQFFEYKSEQIAQRYSV